MTTFDKRKRDNKKIWSQKNLPILLKKQAKHDTLIHNKKEALKKDNTNLFSSLAESQRMVKFWQEIGKFVITF